jgi:hypothetical protein
MLPGWATAVTFLRALSLEPVPLQPPEICPGCPELPGQVSHQPGAVAWLVLLAVLIVSALAVVVGLVLYLLRQGRPRKPRAA